HVQTEEIIDRCVLRMINESARCLEESIVGKASHLDMALILGIGFPPFRGGLLKYADDIGIDNVMRCLGDYHSRHGSRFMPCGFLLEKGRLGSGFYL
ncbi:MAG TPA: 3-hydroxyacyl-CoA dehydrogenase family protein, partial [Spirochaetota bacterium]